jgi:Carboxypeptidase regulatory-like domain
MKLRRLALLIAMLVASACHPGPIINTGGNTVGGTIAGIVSTVNKAALPSRKVTAINTVTGEKFETTTATNGGYTIKVPQGTYRLEVELRDGEKIVKQPGDTKVQNSDLDPQRHFVISGGL